MGRDPDRQARDPVRRRRAAAACRPARSPGERSASTAARTIGCRKRNGRPCLEDPGGGKLIGRGRGDASVHLGQGGREPKVGLAQHRGRTCQRVGGRREVTQPHARPTAKPPGGRGRPRGEQVDAVGAIASSARVRTSSSTRNGTPPVTSWHALANADSTSALSAEPHELGRPPARSAVREQGSRPTGRRRAPRAEANTQATRPAAPQRRPRSADSSSLRAKVAQEAQRGLVSPVGVVDTEQQRGAPAKVRAQPVKPVQDRKGRVQQRFRRVILRRRDAEQPRRAPGSAGKQLRPLRRRSPRSAGPRKVGAPCRTRSPVPAPSRAH